MSGYGGTSMVVLEDPAEPLDDKGLIMNVGPLKMGMNVIKKVTLKNMGQRAAFIRAVAFEGEMI